MSIGEKKFYYKGFQPIYWTLFSGMWSVFVFTFILGMVHSFSRSFDYDPSQPSLSIFGIIISIIVPLVFLFVTITYMLPKFLKGGYFLITQKPILILTTSGLEFIYPFKGFLKWEDIVAMRIVKSFSNMDQLVIKTVNPTPMALKSIKTNWFFLNGLPQVFNKKPKDENTIRYFIKEVGINYEKFEKAVTDYSGSKKNFTFEVI
ncbi:MAG: hypothetical protein IH995_09995 [Proteobacteria bacterium]|nr:hypothetical protein [Pseudomonadota bacterium]